MSKERIKLYEAYIEGKLIGKYASAREAMEAIKEQAGDLIDEEFQASHGCWHGHNTTHFHDNSGDVFASILELFDPVR